MDRNMRYFVFGICILVGLTLVGPITSRLVGTAKGTTASTAAAYSVIQGSPAANAASLLNYSDPLRFTDCKRFEDPLLVAACRIGGAALGAVMNISREDFFKEDALTFDEAFKAFASIEAANFVRVNLSSARYSYLATVARQQLPLGSQQCLEEGAGICGNHVQAFLDIMSALGIKARSIQFYYWSRGRRNSHIAAEVYFLEKWNYFDVTWGFALPLKQRLRFADITALQEFYQEDGLYNNFDAWAIVQNYWNLNSLEYMSIGTADVIVDGIGTVNVHVPDSAVFEETFGDIPNYVGDNQADGKHAKFELHFHSSEAKQATFEISGSAGCDAKGDRLILDNQEHPIRQGPVTFELASPGAVLSTRSEADVCYVVFSKARFEARR
jgi:hypothetical protein